VEFQDCSVPVTIAKNQDATIANPVVFRVTPLTIDQALAMRIITTPPPNSFVSPTTASKN